MKRLFLLALIISISVIIYNCDDAGVTESNKTFDITGKVNNWTLGSMILKAYAKDSSGNGKYLADSTTIATDGSFTVKLKTPTDEFFWSYSVVPPGNCNGAITITPAVLKQTPLTFEVYNSSNTFTGTLQKKSYDVFITPGSHSVSYVNFKEAGSVSGSTTCIGMADTTKVTANYTCTAGWNTVVLVWNQFNPPTQYDATIQNNEPAASLWYYVP
jgi:hypothetical protein